MATFEFWGLNESSHQRLQLMLLSHCYSKTANEVLLEEQLSHIGSSLEKRWRRGLVQVSVKQRHGRGIKHMRGVTTWSWWGETSGSLIPEAKQEVTLHFCSVGAAWSYLCKGVVWDWNSEPSKWDRTFYQLGFACLRSKRCWPSAVHRLVALVADKEWKTWRKFFVWWRFDVFFMGRKKTKKWIPKIPNESF